MVPLLKKPWHDCGSRSIRKLCLHWNRDNVGVWSTVLVDVFEHVFHIILKSPPEVVMNFINKMLYPIPQEQS